jgi:hypothetical protein
VKQLAWIGLSLLAMFVFDRISAARVERMEAEIAVLKQAVAALSQKTARGDDAPSARIVAPIPPTLLSDPPAAPRSSGDPPAAPAKPRETSYADQVAYYHASLQAEHVDATWSRSAAQHLRRIFGQTMGSATTLTSVECRHTICRAELTHDTEGESQAFMETWMHSKARLEWQGPVTGGVMSTERDGSARSAFYFAREGTELPDMP